MWCGNGSYDHVCGELGCVVKWWEEVWGMGNEVRRRGN